jgi:hypothetical protein
MNQEKSTARGKNPEVLKLIERSTQDLHDRVNAQQHLVLTILGQMKTGCPLDLCSVADCPHRRLLREILGETIDVLEQTKKAFKSTKLEHLRRRLLEVLREAA